MTLPVIYSPKIGLYDSPVVDPAVVVIAEPVDPDGASLVNVNVYTPLVGPVTELSSTL